MGQAESMRVSVRGARKAYGTVDALAGVDLDVPEGALLAVLGPSGSGKTTLLRALGGQERLDAGTIDLAGRRVAGPGLHVPTHERGAALVPQDAALFPHLDVAANIAFGLPRRHAREGRHRVEEVLELVGLAGLGGRRPHELSGGQQQRVAVARALAPRPALILLDEPFSALDAALRVGVRAQVRAALRADGATAVLVTHDQGEALSVADQVAVIEAGVVRQVGTPDDVYRRPADAWVANFVGEANVFEGAVVDGRVRTPLGDVLVLPLAGRDADAVGRVLVRPEQVVLGEGPGRGWVTGVDYHGHDALVTVQLSDRAAIYARLAASGSLPHPGDEVRVGVRGSGHPLAD